MMELAIIAALLAQFPGHPPEPPAATEQQEAAPATTGNASLFSWCSECEGSPFKYRRNRAAVRAFRRDNPCPSTGKTTGACKGWVVDHVIALDCAAGLRVPKSALDVARNMRWQTTEAAKKKDRWERQPEACQTLYDVTYGRDR